MPEINDEDLKKLQDAAKERDTLKTELEKLKEKPAPKEEPKAEPKEEDDLADKVKKNRKDSEDRSAELKKIEKAVGFNLAVSKFVDDNKDILPSQVPDILKEAEKEKYDSVSEKAAAVRTSLIKTFFEVQANVDLLTPNQKLTLEDYLKLTKAGKEEKSESVYENIFEPALQMAKKLKKAEELGKSRNGMVTGDKLQDDYKSRLMKISEKTYLGKGDK